MKQLIVLIFLSTIFSTISGFSQSYEQKIPEEYGFKLKIGETVPDFSIILPDGTSTPIKEFRGRVVMLQFTASWCGVCRKEMPHIEKDIWLKWKENPNFTLYGIDLKENAETTLKFQSDMKITYPLALDLDGSIFDLFTVPNSGVTRNIIIDKEGKIAYMTRLFKDEEFKEMVKVIGVLLE
ncbi:MAG: TlpA disulfide reductase family protein [Prolixibacteraceae bacterium]|jgi:peroxiredoxin|nr:TlpA disulfide reductase family protein [Prolixibacteraceae bacterium]